MAKLVRILYKNDQVVGRHESVYQNDQTALTAMTNAVCGYIKVYGMEIANYNLYTSAKYITLTRDDVRIEYSIR